LNHAVSTVSCWLSAIRTSM